MTVLAQARAVSVAFGGGGLLRRRAPLQAVREVSLDVARGESVGLVGESGSGKSTLGRAMLGLVPITAGQVMFDGTDLRELDAAPLRALRQRMQIVFQDPFGSLDPRRRIGAQIGDALAIHALQPTAQQRSAVATLLEEVGLDAAYAARFPHEFSGGQRQRVGLARALASQPEFLVADEPVSALDVSVQAQILALLDGLRRRRGLALLFISHDLPVVRHLCDRVVVLYLGRIMEEGPVASVFARPAHPYTRALLSATPQLDPARRQARILLQGEPPSPANPPSGCVFRTRCAHAVAACGKTVPAPVSVAPGHTARCLRVADLPDAALQTVLAMPIGGIRSGGSGQT